MFSSVRVRLTLSHLAVIVLAMGLSGFLLLSSLERYFLQATEDSLVAQARITAQALIPGAVAEGPPGEALSEASDRLAPIYNTAQQQQLGLTRHKERTSEPFAGDDDLGLGTIHPFDDHLGLVLL